MTEKRKIRELGAKQHPMSGAGRIKGDGSDDEFMYEIKDANLSITIKGEELEKLWRESTRSGKTPIFVVQFTSGVQLLGEVSMSRLGTNSK